MLKSNQAEDLVSKSMTTGADDGVPVKDVDLLASVRPAVDDEPRESPVRRRHRLRMKAFFAAARKAS